MDESSNELTYLTDMTDVNCNCVPRLLDWCITEQSDEERIPGGYVLILAMEKIDGQNLESASEEFPLEKRNKVRIGFARALRLLDFPSYDKLIRHKLNFSK